ncbi:hypothetical protein L5515_012562 [Caenorhabditis briggsae]|uniref:Uncharacterized protein n=1 Tax=Caenorhabditis briggsae TaxID=6238 RepID=A0AAE9EZ04_CAEBR|nr:hypothetical protein L5515_012562 [Caenorhabditis briggsae]
MLMNYELAIGEIPRFVIVSYDGNNSLRWKNMAFLVQAVSTGWLCSVFSLYPPIDSIAFMVIVTEYKKVIKEQLHYMFFPPESQSASRTSTDQNAKPIQMS